MKEGSWLETQNAKEEAAWLEPRMTRRKLDENENEEVGVETQKDQ